MTKHVRRALVIALFVQMFGCALIKPYEPTPQKPPLCVSCEDLDGLERLACEIRNCGPISVTPRPTPSPTEVVTPPPLPSPTPSPEPRPSVIPPTLLQFRNQFYAGHVQQKMVDFGDGKKVLAWMADSTRDYVIPAGYPNTPSKVCDKWHEINYKTWCQNRDWDGEPAIWNENMKPDRSFEKYGVRVQPVAHPGYQAWIEVIYGEVRVRTCPRKPNVTWDGIEVPVKWNGCYQAVYRCTKSPFDCVKLRQEQVKD